MKGIRAFTLIELLVVTTIVVILAALLLPVLGRSARRTKAVVCRNNLKQWGMAMQMFAADNSDLLPPEGFANPTDHHTNSGWYIQLPQTLGIGRYHDVPWRTNAAIDPGVSLWICPENPRRSNGKNLFHYCLNGYVDGAGEKDYPVKLSWIPQPRRLVYLFDSKNLPAVASGGGKPWNFVHTNLHNAGAHFVFVDGHVERFANADYWNLKAGTGRTNHPDIAWSPR